MPIQAMHGFVEVWAIRKAPRQMNSFTLGTPGHQSAMGTKALGLLLQAQDRRQ